MYIIDSNTAWTEGNVVYLTTNKRAQNAFIVCIRSQNLQKDEALCYNKIKIKTQSLLDYWVTCMQWMDLKMLNIISKHLYRN